MPDSIDHAQSLTVKGFLRALASLLLSAGTEVQNLLLMSLLILAACSIAYGIWAMATQIIDALTRK